MDPVNRNFY